MECDVSVIVPTFKDWKRLNICLLALDKQTYPQNKFEIIVINNHPSDLVPVDFFIPKNCNIILETRPGSYAARNTGVKISKGKWIGFTDSDCIPDPEWIKNAVSIFEFNKNISRIAGQINLFYKSENLTTAELFEKVYAFRQDWLSRKGLCVTGNMFTLKSLFDDIGFFNEELFSGGDMEWSERATKAKKEIIFASNVIVNHPARNRISQLSKKFKRVAGGTGYSRKVALGRALLYTIPPIHMLFGIKKLTISERIRITALRYYLNQIRSLEELKIAFGKVANRE